jgi:hypothetical protein
MRTRRSLVVTSAIAVFGALIYASGAFAGGGNSSNAKACQKNGWKSLVTDTGQAFASEQACVSYAAKGGVLKRTQTISFTSANPSPATVGASYTPTATATSGLSVTFVLDAASTGCSLSGGVVSFTAAGTCVIIANQPGDATYIAAPQVQQSITVLVPPPVCAVTNSATGTQFTSLTAAIAAATAGDELTIAGTCTGNFTVDKNLSLRGIDAAGVKATLNGGSTPASPGGTVLDVPSGVTGSVANLRITNGAIGVPGGGGIDNAGTLSLADSIVTANRTGGAGGGIRTTGALTIIRSVVSENQDVLGGGGIAAWPGATVSVTDSTISENNSATFGGGVKVEGGATVTITTSSITGNDADNGGGGIAVFGSLNLNSSTITGNTAFHERGGGGGIFAATGAPVTASGTNTVTGNTVAGAPDNCAPDELLPGCI